MIKIYPDHPGLRLSSAECLNPVKKGNSYTINLREKIYKNYRIVYRIKGELIEIVAICHGAKPLDDIL